VQREWRCIEIKFKKLCKRLAALGAALALTLSSSGILVSAEMRDTSFNTNRSILTGGLENKGEDKLDNSSENIYKTVENKALSGEDEDLNKESKALGEEDKHADKEDKALGEEDKATDFENKETSVEEDEEDEAIPNDQTSGETQQSNQENQESQSEDGVLIEANVPTNIAVREVSTWDEFKDAYNNETVEEIHLKGDITATGGNTFQGRKNNIEITGAKEDGSYHKLIFPKEYSVGDRADLPLSQSITTKIFNIHDIQILSDGLWNDGDRDQESPQSALLGPNSDQALTGWNFEIGNISTDSKNPIPRLVSCSGRVTFSGKVDLTTIYSAVQAGDLYFSKDSNYSGNTISDDSSAISLVQNPATTQKPLLRGSIGYGFNVAEGTTVKLESTGEVLTGGTLTVGKNAKLIIISTGKGTDKSVALTMKGKTTLTTSEGSLLSLTSVDGTALLLNGDNINCTIGKGSTFLAYGHTGKHDTGYYYDPIGTMKAVGAIAVHCPSNDFSTSLLLDSPAVYDIANKGGGEWLWKTLSYSYVSINGANINTWSREPFNINGPPTQSFNLGSSGNIKLTGSNSSTIEDQMCAGFTITGTSATQTIKQALMQHLSRVSSETGAIVTEELKLIVPKTINFGTIKYNYNIGLDKKLAEPLAAGSQLAVSDTRKTKVPWTVSAKTTKELTNSVSNRVVSGAIAYLDNGNLKSMALNVPVDIVSDTNTTEIYNISGSKWNGTNTGICLDYHGLPIEKGTYNGTIEWTLTNGP
jgi:hypothetical protein